MIRIMKYISKAIVFSVILSAALFSCDSYERTGVADEIYVNKSAITLFAGEKDTLIASPADGSATQWTVADDDVATVQNGVVTAVAAGNTSITARRGGAVFTVAVTVVDKHVLTDITLTAATSFGEYVLEMQPGKTKLIEATTVPGNANDVPITDYAWWSDDESVARVYSDGTVVSVKSGATKIHYRRGTIVKDVNVYVSATSSFRGPHILSKDAPLVLPFIDFDFGGKDVAWHDTSSGDSGGGNYRKSYGDNDSKDVDVEGSRNIGWTANGEWLLYTIDVKDAGVYTMDLKVSGSGGVIHFELDGEDITGPLSVGATGGWGDFQYKVSCDINLSQGRHKLKACMDNANYNLQYMRFTFAD